jgi:hypothetical protein
MGGARGTGAFPKGGADAGLLLKMFISGELDMNAEPTDVLNEFESLKDKTTAQVRSGFNRVRDLAREGMAAFTDGAEGK